jgi:lipoprotein NlpI
MSALRIALPLVAALICADMATAAGIDDANKAVLAARDGKYEEAIRLFSSALNGDELNLTSRAQAYTYRGIAKAAIGDYEGGREDLNSAIALQSDYAPEAYAYRGYFELVRNESDKAAADLAKSASLKIWAYNVIWLSLAREKAHVPDTDNLSLKAHAARLNLTQWVKAAAMEGDPAKLNERVCDADFYVAEHDLANANAAAAKPLLQHAAEECPFASFERMGATAELMGLK